MSAVAPSPTQNPEPRTPNPERISILSLKLRNFKGAGDLFVDFGGKEVCIFGRNGAGKSTIADAVFWLLFDKNSLGKEDFEKRPIVPLDDEEPNVRRPGSNLGVPDRNVVVEAEMVLQIGSNRMTLKKQYIAKHEGVRGQAALGGGNTTNHTVNGVPAKACQYEQQVAAILESSRSFGMMDANAEERFRLLTDPTYFNSKLAWKKRRDLVIEACGDVSDAAVIASNPDLEDLPAILGEHSLSDYRQIVDSKQKNLNSERENLPALIAENKLHIKPADRTIVQLNAEIEVEARKRETYAGYIRELGTGEAKTSKKKRLGEIDLEILNIRTDAARGQSDQVATQQRALGALRTAADEAARLVRQIERDIEEKQANISMLEGKRDRFRAEWKEIRARRFAPITSETCNLCGQSIPADKIEEKNQAGLEAFNLKKSTEQEENEKKGLVVARALEGEQSALGQLQSALVTAKSSVDEAKAKVEAFNPSTAEPATLTVDPRIAALEQEKGLVAAELAGMDDSSSAEREKWEAKIKVADEAVTAFNAQIAQLNQNAQAQKRIDEHQAKEKAIGVELERLQFECSLMDKFVRTKVELLEGLINSRFKLARFKLFETLENGNVKECCEATDEAGVPFSSLNHGSRLNVGLDIINTLAEHFGFAPFVLIDNAESVTSILPTVGQQIRLVVSAADDILRFETQKESA